MPSGTLATCRYECVTLGTSTSRTKTRVRAIVSQGTIGKSAQTINVTVKRESGLHEEVNNSLASSMNGARLQASRITRPCQTAETSCCLHREGFITQRVQDDNPGVCRHAVFDGLHDYVFC